MPLLLVPALLFPALLPTPRCAFISASGSASRSALSFFRAQSLYANDGDNEIDWDKEVTSLTKTQQNRYFQALKQMEPPQLVREFAETAPPEVQNAVKLTISQLLGNIPAQVAESAITARGTSLASLMFSMQMTGYMFRNAEYRRALLQASTPAQLPPVNGTLTVKVAGLEAKVDAQSYMAELRAEVQALREQLSLMQQQRENGELALINYIQSLGPQEARKLSSQVSPDVLEAMGQLVSSILTDYNISPDMVAKAPVSKVRELLIVQLVSGYRLRELEAREELKDKFWDQ